MIVRPVVVLRGVLLFVYGFNGAVGTNLGVPAYYVVPGISWVDLIIVFHLLRTIRKAPEGATLAVTAGQVLHGALMAGLALWLTLSTLVNSFSYATPLGDFVPPLKLLFFIVMVHVVRMLASGHGMRLLIGGFLTGMFTVAALEVIYSERSVAGLPLLVNPNVTGAMLGIGTAVAAMGMVFTTARALNLTAGLVLAGMSIFSFSKGAWLMCALGLVAMLTLAFRRSGREARPRRRRGLQRFVIPAAVTASIVLAVQYRDLIVNTVAFKFETTSTGGSADVRANLAVAGLKAALDHPVLGLGYRNYYQVRNLYPEMDLPPLEREDNAHNLFAQTLAVGGFPAGLLLLGVMALPLWVYWQKIMSLAWTPLVRMTVWATTSLVWIIYAAVQLQLIAQPPFWFFCGLVFAVRRKVRAAVPIPKHAAVQAVAPQGLV